MKHLFNALKEHWQIYVGLLLGLIIGLLVGIGFTDWKSLVKGFDSKVTDWISAISTAVGICIAWRAAQSWKQQKAPDLKKKLLDDMIDFGRVCFIYQNNPQEYLDSLPESRIEILRHMSIIDIGFKSLKFFDPNLSEVLIKKFDDFKIELDKLFTQKEPDKSELTTIFSNIISLGAKCEDIILGKDGSS